MRGASIVSALAFTLALSTVCGNPEEEDDPVPVDTLAVPVDTFGGPLSTIEATFTPVDLPSEFPPDFPVAPASTVVSASTTPDAGGAYSEISIATEGDSSESYAWYRQALTDAGWQVSSEGQTDETRTLHATQGESYVDLTVMPHPDRSDGWVRVNASIWKAGT
ncbi:MAG TPA: hypothetical protein VFQ21_00450 [Gemmatimonadota bacterium]|nr:hypothetical protein [Gemmatimonadota bacterium]